MLEADASVYHPSAVALSLVNRTWERLVVEEHVAVLQRRLVAIAW